MLYMSVMDEQRANGYIVLQPGYLLIDSGHLLVSHLYYVS